MEWLLRRRYAHHFYKSGFEFADLSSWIELWRGLRHKDGLQKDPSMNQGKDWVIWGWVGILAGLVGEVNYVRMRIAFKKSSKDFKIMRFGMARNCGQEAYEVEVDYESVSVYSPSR